MKYFQYFDCFWCIQRSKNFTDALRENKQSFDIGFFNIIRERLSPFLLYLVWSFGGSWIRYCLTTPTRPRKTRKFRWSNFIYWIDQRLMLQIFQTKTPLRIQINELFHSNLHSIEWKSNEITYSLIVNSFFFST